MSEPALGEAALEAAMMAAMMEAMDAAMLSGDDGVRKGRGGREKTARERRRETRSAIFQKRSDLPGISILNLMNLSDVTSKWLLLVVSTKRLPRAFF